MPSAKAELRLKKWFPNLAATGYKITSKQNARYNCAAWAGCDTTTKWWPTHLGGYFWPLSSRDETVENFIRAYELLGYQVCDNAELEPGLEKIAIYLGPDGLPSHVARQCETGNWTSKVGDYEDIEHNSLSAFDSSDYGQVAQIMKRPRTKDCVIPNAEKI